MAFRQPPAGVVQVLEGVAVLLVPSKRIYDWKDIKIWLGSNPNNLITMLKNFEVDQLTEEQLQRLISILACKDCEPERVLKCSIAGHMLCMWLRAIVQYSTVQRQQQQQQQTV
ncbi:unnamed protein product [Rotaria sp. Silwood1]|nr:unnamed protein product [Rotaria sp. Silwood1]CAF0964501.1 unnamed protein product [Rotaria sp. Silwood1]CAF3380972.1 unnamed protein product [Rotaria sp. Silwood1]CAF3413604.1 unnamed protein product [Rotaria sp. Silwood1]CAF3417331.1 unnamed protein product [Rotaria sp. Silwood1]